MEQNFNCLNKIIIYNEFEFAKKVLQTKENCPILSNQGNFFKFVYQEENNINKIVLIPITYRFI